MSPAPLMMQRKDPNSAPHQHPHHHHPHAHHHNSPTVSSSSSLSCDRRMSNNTNNSKVNIHIDEEDNVEVKFTNKATTTTTTTTTTPKPIHTRSKTEDPSSLVRSIKRNTSNSSVYSFFASGHEDASEWEESLAAVESILEPDSAAMAVLTSEQVEGLRKVQTILRGRSSSKNKYHIPRGLREASSLGRTSESDEFLLAQFGGIHNPTKVDYKQRVQKIITANRFIHGLMIKAESSKILKETKSYPLPEWIILPKERQVELAQLLSWDNLSSWGSFDIFKVAELTDQKPLLFVGWAILASPYSQQVMQEVFQTDQQKEQQDKQQDDQSTVAGTKSLASGRGVSNSQPSRSKSSASGYSTASIINSMKRFSTVTSSPSSSKMTSSTVMDDIPGYGFLDQFKVSQQALVDFLRCIESDYHKSNPYHNHIHAADVTQSLHALLWGMGGKEIMAHSDLELFSLLLAAVVHDVGHPGYNNNFQVNSRSDLALQYNDTSVLENMHASRAFIRIMGNHHGQALKMDIFGKMTNDQIAASRKTIINAVLETDMTKHFCAVSKIKGIGMEYLREKQKFDETNNNNNKEYNLSNLNKEDALEVFMYMLHLADISNAAKPTKLAIQWTDRCLDEFFQQGDEEKRLGLPVSPLCDRETTKRPDSQIGFIKFVVQPAFEVLGKLLPAVNQEILPLLEANLEFWKREQILESTIITIPNTSTNNNTNSTNTNTTITTINTTTNTTCTSTCNKKHSSEKENAAKDPCSNNSSSSSIGKPKPLE